MPHRVTAEDRAFQRDFEVGKLAPAAFGHAAHVRLAYIYLSALGPEPAYPQMRSALLHFLAHHGIDRSKYHETLTRAWLLAVHHFMQQTPDTDSAADFMENSPRLFEKGIMHTHYSDARLFSEQARSGFMPPDLDPIPLYA